MEITKEKQENVVIKFAGDSGDGIQLLGSQFTSSTALKGNDLANFPDYPAEIRAPRGTIAGISGFQMQFGSREVNTPGDECDVLIAMNAAALQANMGNIKKGAIIIADLDGFDARNLSQVGYESNPLEDGSLDDFSVYPIEITKNTREALAETGMSLRDRDRSRNMYVLGVVYWIYSRNPKHTIEFLEQKFGRKPELLEANVSVLKAGYHFAETGEIFSSRFEIEPAPMEKGSYRGIMGNQGLALGLITAAEKAGLSLFYGSYPITPASDILHILSRHKNFGVKTFQAEDEIAAVCAAIGASYGGGLGATGTSGPGMALKTEAMGLAFMLELPLIIVNVQRGGPSTGLPTKTEQSDLLQAVYGRNGEAPLPVVACASPSDCFSAAFEAARIAIEHMTPVILLSDGYIGNGAEPWKYPTASSFPEIKANKLEKADTSYQPYARDERLVRSWAVPGIKGLEHRIGGLEKEDITGNVSFESENHEKMVKLRAEKVDKIAEHVPEQTVAVGDDKGKLAVLAWGSTYGAIKSAVTQLNEEGFSVSHIHLRHVHPFPKNLEDLLRRFDKVLIPEMNNGQLIKMIRDKFLIDAKGVNKIKGQPFTVKELKEEILTSYNA